MIKTAIALIAVINIITGQANTCHCHHSNIAINIKTISWTMIIWGKESWRCKGSPSKNDPKL